MALTVLEFFYRFQTAIVGILGFAGVIVTIRQNANLVRRQYQREIDHEKNALRVALCSELEAIRRTYDDRINLCKVHREQGPVLIPIVVENRIYLKLNEKLGLLSGEEIAAVIEAYSLVSELPDRLKLLELEYSTKTEESRGYFFVSGDQIEVVEATHKAFLEKIKIAIQYMQKKRYMTKA
jgi:hypothetical protein